MDRLIRECSHDPITGMEKMFRMNAYERSKKENKWLDYDGSMVYLWLTPDPNLSNQ
jgi:hypothetical protein